VPPIPARVPGSVQGALRAAGRVPDWNVGVNARACEWVENRHWMYRVRLPDEWFGAPAQFRLECLGLDYAGWVYVNGREAGSFHGAHVPHVFEVTPYLNPTGNVLEIVFDLPPRWLGQFGYTSQMTEWKTRFNYTWDWVPRLVQIGIWDSISLVAVAGGEICDLQCSADANPHRRTGILRLAATVAGASGYRVHVQLERNGAVIRAETRAAADVERGLTWDDLAVELWWPNLEGAQPLYSVTCRLLDADSREHDRQERRVGFRRVEWKPCDGASPEADPWVCVVNGRPVFLQGVNFPPLRATFADLTLADYRARLSQYRDLGLNLFRINGCQFLERAWFYDLCDEMGLLVWQDFPITSSGIENWPPEDENSIEAMAQIARSYIMRRKHHAALVLWSGGNELCGDLEGRKIGIGKPCGLDHPMLRRLQQVVVQCDPGRRFIPTSPSGPLFSARPENFGKGLHWDVHDGGSSLPIAEAEAYWAADDALFRSEVYCAGASSAELIRKYAGDFQTFPPTADNPYWSRITVWWLDWQKLIALHGRQPRDLAEYVAWSQENQAHMMGREMQVCKSRFPRCGGVLMWSGHDTFPLAINTSLIDFDGHLKPVASAVSAVWHSKLEREFERRQRHEIRD
jgi:beta-mannosidase